MKKFMILPVDKKLTALQWAQLTASSLSECPRDALGMHYIVSYRGLNPLILPTYPRYTLEEIRAVQELPQWSPPL